MSSKLTLKKKKKKQQQQQRPRSTSSASVSWWLKKRKQRSLAKRKARMSAVRANRNANSSAAGASGHESLGSSNNAAAAGASTSSISATTDLGGQSHPNPTTDSTGPNSARSAPGAETKSGRAVTKGWHSSTCGLCTLAKECGECGAARPSGDNTNGLNSSAEKLMSKRKRSAWEESSLSLSSSSLSSSSSSQQQPVGTCTSRPPVLPVIDITDLRGVPRDCGGEKTVVPTNLTDAASSVSKAVIPAALETKPMVARCDDGTTNPTGTHTNSTTSPTKLSLLQTLTKERKERVAEMARYEELYRTLTQSLDSTLTENATLRKILDDRDEEQLQFETTLAFHEDALRNRSVDVLRHRQAVLLGLHHAKHCQVDPMTTCPVEYCGRYKELLQHNTTCKAASCDYPHCRTHRALQQHADRCRNDACLLCQPLREAIRGEKEKTVAALAIASMRHGDAGASVLSNGGGGGSGAAPEKAPTLDEGQQQQNHHQEHQTMVQNALRQYQHQQQQQQQQQQMVAEQSEYLQPPTAQQPPRPTPSQPMPVEKPPCAGAIRGKDQEGQDQEQQTQQSQQVLVEEFPLLQPPPSLRNQATSDERQGDQQQQHTETSAAAGKTHMPPSSYQRRSLPPSSPQEMLCECPQPPDASPGQEQNLHQEYEQEQQRQPMRQLLLALRTPAASIVTREPENHQQQQGQTPAGQTPTAVGRTGTPPPLAQSKSTKRRTASPLAPVNPNRSAIPSSVGPGQSKKRSIYSPLRKRRQSLHGSVTKALLSQANRGRRDSGSLSLPRARFAKQLQAGDESSTESEAPSSIGTEDSFHQIDSVGVLVCRSCTESGSPIQLCSDCEKPNLDIFLHAVTCQNVECTAVHCGEMKVRLQHLQTCETGFVGGCRACRFILPLFRLHARKCQLNQCPIPSCATMKSCANCNVDAAVEEKAASVAPKPSLCSICQSILPPALLHSAKCVDTACVYPACSEIKGHIGHWMACSNGPGCPPCRRYTAVLRVHSIECRDSSCPIASCAAAKASLFRPALFRAPAHSTPPETRSDGVWL